MRREMVQVLYYTRTTYGWRKHYEVMSVSDYNDLLLDDVIIKRKKYIKAVM